MWRSDNVGRVDSNQISFQEIMVGKVMGEGGAYI